MSSEDSFLEGLDEENNEQKQEEKSTETEDEIVVEGKTVDDTSTRSGNNSLLKPVSDIDDVVELYDQFEEIKGKLLKTDDKTEISGNIHINKSGWRKIATAFNISVETIAEKRIVEDGIVKYRVKAKATAPNGKTATGVAMAASNESNHMEKISDNKKNKPDRDNVYWIDNAWRRLKSPKEVNEHNIFATAATRAKNRAISDCVGGGEVSAEEISADDVL